MAAARQGESGEGDKVEVRSPVRGAAVGGQVGSDRNPDQGLDTQRKEEEDSRHILEMQ